MIPIEMTSTIIASLFGSTVLGSLITAWFGRRKNNADASMVLVEATLKWAGNMADRIATLEAHLTTREALIDSLQDRIACLEEKLAELLGVPKEEVCAQHIASGPATDKTV